MPRQRTGFVYEKGGRWYARFSYTDSEGKRRDIRRRAKNKSDGWKIIKREGERIDKEGPKILESVSLTFEQFADWYEKHYIRPAVYAHDRKIAGLRSARTAKGFLKPLKAYFGKRRIQSLTRLDIEGFKEHRLLTPKLAPSGDDAGPRAIASVNRELALLRTILAAAVDQGILSRSPFRGATIINLADEVRRDRVLTSEEETRLLEHCAGPRAHIRPVVICALDTGMRKGEMLSLQWKDVDLAKDVITVRAKNTKTMRQRQVAMTRRLKSSLQGVWDESLQRPDDLVFGLKEFKRAWHKALEKARISGLRFHDLRHTCATRLVAAEIPLAEVGRFLGHTQPQTTYRYVNPDLDASRKAAEALEKKE